MTMVQPITSAVRQISPEAFKQAASVAARSAYGNIATGQAVSATAAGGFGLAAWLGQFLQTAHINGVSLFSQPLTSPVLQSSLLGNIGLGTIMIGDLITAGAAGAAAYALNSFTRITTGTGLIGLGTAGLKAVASGFSKAGSAITGLFSGGRSAVAQQSARNAAQQMRLVA